MRSFAILVATSRLRCWPDRADRRENLGPGATDDLLGGAGLPELSGEAELTAAGGVRTFPRPPIKKAVTTTTAARIIEAPTKRRRLLISHPLL